MIEGASDLDIPPAFRQTEFASTYKSRINQNPADSNPKVAFEGARGEYICTLKPPPDPILENILDDAGINGIQYKNAVPDFSPVTIAQVEIDHMYGGVGRNAGKARYSNFAQADEMLVIKLNNSSDLVVQFGMESGTVTMKDIQKYRKINKLTWHELNNATTMQLVPTEINSSFGHLGGIGEINAGMYSSGGIIVD